MVEERRKVPETESAVAVLTERINHLIDRLEKLESWHTWLLRTVGTGIITVCVGIASAAIIAALRLQQ